MDPVVTQQQILEFRQRVLAGEELTEAELRQATAALRAKRQMAADLAGTRSRSGKPAATVRSADELKALFGAPVTQKN